MGRSGDGKRNILWGWPYLRTKIFLLASAREALKLSLYMVIPSIGVLKSP